MGSSIETEAISQGLEVFIIIFFINFIRLFLAPYQIEARIIARFVSKIVLWLMEVLKIWTKEPGDNDLVERTIGHIRVLRQKIKKVKIKIG